MKTFLAARIGTGFYGGKKVSALEVFKRMSGRHLLGINEALISRWTDLQENFGLLSVQFSAILCSEEGTSTVKKKKSHIRLINIKGKYLTGVHYAPL